MVVLAILIFPCVVLYELMKMNGKRKKHRRRKRRF